MKKIIIALLFITSVALSNDVLDNSKALPFEYMGLSSVINLISDDAVTDTNDSLETGWISLGNNANYVSLFLSVDDTVDIRWYLDYAVGSAGTYYVTTAIDSIKSTGTASEQVSVGKVLRNSSATDLIPGANFIRFRAYFQSASEASGIFRAWLNTRQ